MNIHEYQAKSLLRKHGVETAKGEFAGSVDDAVEAARRLGGNVWAVKAQIHAGGRGKAGGVKIARSLDEVRACASAILGAVLVTPQTGKEGRLVRRLYVECGEDIAREIYLSLLIDTRAEAITFVASCEGGMDIEEVAASTPEKIFTLSIDPATGFLPWHGRALATALNLQGSLGRQIGDMSAALYRAFSACDASLIEINPLVVTKDDKLLCLDAKMNFDSNALYRQPDILQLRDTDEEDPKELEASDHDLNYIRLDGTIGCMVNGAGLAMATMDLVQLEGGSPANFLDVGGGATHQQVSAAFRLLLSDPNVEGVLVNIFGGIMRCDIIAEGIVAAASEVKLDRPLVVRLEGTNVDKGKEILGKSDLPITSVDGLGAAARTIVQLVQSAKETRCQ